MVRLVYAQCCWSYHAFRPVALGFPLPPLYSLDTHTDITAPAPLNLFFLPLQPKQITEIRDFLQKTQRKDAKCTRPFLSANLFCAYFLSANTAECRRRNAVCLQYERVLSGRSHRFRRSIVIFLFILRENGLDVCPVPCRYAGIPRHDSQSTSHINLFRPSNRVLFSSSSNFALIPVLVFSRVVCFPARAACKIKKSSGVTKFKVRCSRYLYTLVVNDSQKANKLQQALPPGTRAIPFSAALHCIMLGCSVCLL
jgi:hypothetical protein